jgi:hypothetical protein
MRRRDRQLVMEFRSHGGRREGAGRKPALAGPVLFGRYHLRALRTPREVRNALAYVLLNVRKHWRQRTGTPPPVRLDVASSGAWFDGWKRSPPTVERPGLREVARPRVWLLVKGWRQHGLIDPAETPGPLHPARRRVRVLQPIEQQ